MGNHNSEDTPAVLQPWDEANRELASLVRPADWKNPEPASHYNLVVIGAGTAGLVTAAGAAGLGARVALVERHMLGGDCLNVGCVPSKALLAASRAAAAVRDADRFGVLVPEGVRVDFPRVMERMRRLRASIAPNDSAQRLADLGVDVFFGNARFVDSQTVDVDGTRLRFQKAVIATGARAAAPPIAGLETVPYLTNESLFSLTELPQRLGIIGAGPIGCEMAQAFARFGSRVFLVEALHGILPREDPDASQIVWRVMERDGVELLCCGRDLALSPGPDGAVRIRVHTHGRARQEDVDHLLVAVGRAPNLEGLDLDRVGVAATPKGVVVDERLRTTHPKIYAAGDVCSPYQFTHAADFMARIVIQNALFWGRAKASALTIPWCTYTDPEIAHVGLYEKEARKQGVEIRTFDLPLSQVDRAVLEGRSEGMVRVHTRKESDRIVGATVVAPNAGDMIGELSLAITHQIGLKGLAAAIHPYPTVGEGLRKAGDLYNRSRLTPRTKKMLAKLMAWRLRLFNT
ncbi:Pyruvate/2-oxoglutarate dehydrogenase complex, dihydrolipoamide dehydrogenase (E3) component [Desulfacinum hydrothermale DSM 13146]|uniref:Pyruvate/2-oxoglutarate dehydrogenase complex, dihydrolipoamide dehydrogenase (E3) component n=1 Tax=Desulfacinum hydrothermale DSM 13146 TaxID=1121390 RepID=A0A1W1XG92_9BACT|nr:mercuric reductase [Desulfacinum hydrothermale]SMC22969.1 Pyruvate/2-oxoglutarate dehydrogenase complex, dihydrolipoamide dehydrogenase (E3) component [Desulfacinum hydrothermale DSM 13146]